MHLCAGRIAPVCWPCALPLGPEAVATPAANTPGDSSTDRGPGCGGPTRHARTGHPDARPTPRTPGRGRRTGRPDLRRPLLGRDGAESSAAFGSARSRRCASGRCRVHPPGGTGRGHRGGTPAGEPSLCSGCSSRLLGSPASLWTWSLTFPRCPRSLAGGDASPWAAARRWFSSSSRSRISTRAGGLTVQRRICRYVWKPCSNGTSSQP